MKRKTLALTALVLVVSMLAVLTACGSSNASAETAASPEASAEAAGASSGASSGAVDTIMTVGTTQAFSDEPVQEEDIRTILLAGLASESAINQQPWFFVAITDRDVMAEISASGGMPGGGSMPSFSKDGEAPSFPQGGGMPAPPDGVRPERPADGEAPSFPRDGEMPASADGVKPERPADGEAPSFPQDGEAPSFPQGGGMPAAAAGGSGAKAGLGDSPLAIVIYKNTAGSSPNPDFDCGLAAQNMYVAAASLGYGVKIVSSPTMALNGTNHDQICEKLGVEPSMSAVAVLLIGKPDTAVDGVTGATVRAGLDEKTSIVG